MAWCQGKIVAWWIGGILVVYWWYTGVTVSWGYGGMVSSHNFMARFWAALGDCKSHYHDLPLLPVSLSAPNGVTVLFSLCLSSLSSCHGIIAETQTSAAALHCTHCTTCLHHIPVEAHPGLSAL